jgi:hypothetical protein
VPRGPKGEKRPADVSQCAVMIAKIATGELEDATTDDGKNPPPWPWGAWAGKPELPAEGGIKRRKGLKK